MARQMQENFRVKGKKLYFGFVDLEKAFDRVPREVISWAMRRLGVEEWLVSAVMSMYTGDMHNSTVVGWFMTHCLQLNFQLYTIGLVRTCRIRYDTRCYFNVRSKADISQLNLPHGTDN